MTTHIDSELPLDFWRATPHLFIPAHWGPEYCRCCLDEQASAIHEVEVDGSTHAGNCTGYRVARAGEVLFAVVGWSDNGAGCSYSTVSSYEQALSMADDLKAQGDPGRRGLKYDHYLIQERRYFTAVDTNVVVLP